MKKLFTYFIVCVLSLSLVGCSSSKNNDDILRFFDAFHYTLDAKSANVTGSLDMKNNKNTSKIKVNASLIQEDKIQLALKLGLESNENTANDFIEFYIKDGKTYLKNRGTTSQSVASKIGIEDGKRLSSIDPFLSYSDEELENFFTASSRNGNTYTFTIDPDKLSQLLDNLGSVSVSEANVEATISKKHITHLKLYAKGTMSVSSKKTNTFEFTLNVQIKDYNQVKEVTYPDNLESY